VKKTDTHSEYVIHIAVPRQQWLRERASVLRYVYIACLVRYVGSAVSNTIWLIKWMGMTCRTQGINENTNKMLVGKNIWKEESLCMGARIGLSWFRIASSSGRLWTRRGFDKNGDFFDQLKLLLLNKKTAPGSWRLSYSCIVFTDGARNSVVRSFFSYSSRFQSHRVSFFNTFLLYLLMEINFDVTAFWYEGQRSVYMLKGFLTLTAKRK
jgi:hypothetical protein